MLSDDGRCHEKHRMCWNSQLGMRVVPGTCNDSQASGAVVWNKGSWKNRPERLWWPGSVGLCFYLERAGFEVFFFVWIVTCYGLCFEEITNVWWLYWRGHGQSYMDSPEEGFCWDLCIRSFVEIGIQRSWEAVRMLRAETTELTIIGCKDQCLDYPVAEFI